MTEIKICGITNREDALAAVGAGVDALGFVFWPKSPRYVPPEQVRKIRDNLPEPTVAVGVFVDEPAAVIQQIVEIAGLDMIQLHGHELPEDCRSFSREQLLKALSPRSATEIDQMGDYPVRAFLLDAYDPSRLGGTGKLCDWTLAEQAARRFPVVLAGGLTDENVAEALERVRPAAVDVSSGVERSPGKKDHDKLWRFCTAARESEAGQAPLTTNRIFTQGEKP